MPHQTIFEGQAIRSELVVTILEKHGFHPEQHETSTSTDTDDLERPTYVTVPEEELERAKQVLYGESDKDRYEF